MSNLITTTELQNAIGSDAYAGITDNSTSAIETLILGLADARALSALRRSGYLSISVTTLSAYSTADQYAVKSLAIRCALAFGCSRRGVPVPQYLDAWMLPADFDTAKVRLPDTAPDITGAPGGLLVGDSGTQSDPGVSRGTTLGMDKTGGYP